MAAAPLSVAGRHHSQDAGSTSGFELDLQLQGARQDI